MAVESKKSKVFFNTAILVFLELSKCHVYDFFYNKVKPFYGNSCQLLYSDTDSPLLNVNTFNLKKISKNLKGTLISVISTITTDYLTRRGSKFLVKLKMRWRAVSFRALLLSKQNVQR